MSLGSCIVETAADYTRFVPQSNRRKRGVILCHGAGSAGEWTDPVNQLASVILAIRVASEGIPCIAGPFGGDTWGNDTAAGAGGAIDSAFTALQAMGAASDKFAGIGVSMGHDNLCRYAENQPSKVAAGVGIIPVSDPVSMYTNNTSGYRASIAAAWSVTYPAALPARADLIANASTISGIPWWLNYSTADTTILPSTVTALAAAIGSSCTASIISTTLNHSNAAVQAFVDAAIPANAASSLIAFLLAAGC